MGCVFGIVVTALEHLAGIPCGSQCPNGVLVVHPNPIGGIAICKELTISRRIDHISEERPHPYDHRLNWKVVNKVWSCAEACSISWRPRKTAMGEGERQNRCDTKGAKEKRTTKLWPHHRCCILNKMYCLLSSVMLPPNLAILDV